MYIRKYYLKCFMKYDSRKILPEQNCAPYQDDYKESIPNVFLKHYIRKHQRNDVICKKTKMRADYKFMIKQLTFKVSLVRF